MADFSSYDTTDNPSGPEKPRVFSLKVLNDLDILKRNAKGDTIGTPVPAMLKAYVVGNKIHFKVTLPDNSDAEAMAGIYELREDLNAAKYAIKQFKPEAVATGSLLALDNANEAVVQYDSTVKLVAVGGPAAGVRRYSSGFDLDGGDYVRIPCTITTSGLGSPATTTTKNGETGWLLDDANDEIRVSAQQPVPKGWTAGHDCVLELICALNQAETIGDTLDAQANYKTALIGTGGFGGSTSNATSNNPATTGGVSDGDYQRVTIPLARADATNPTAVDRMVQAVVKRNGLTNVGGYVVMSAALLVPCFTAVAHR